VKCFGALVISVDELFMHYFQNIRQLMEALPQTPIGAPFMDPAGVGPVEGRTPLCIPGFAEF